MDKITLVILAAGKGTRFKPLSETTPKPMLKIANKPAIQYSIEAALPFVNEIIFVVSYLKESFISYFGNEFKGIPIKYLELDEIAGTGHAVYQAKDCITSERFLLLYGDDLYENAALERIMDKQNAVLGMYEENWQHFGIFELKDNKYLVRIIEKPQAFVGNLVNTGAYVLEKKVLDCFTKIEKSVRGEYEFTDMLTLFAKDTQVEVVEIKSGWSPLSYPWHLLSANESKLKDIEEKIEGEIEIGATIKGVLQLGKGSVVKSGAYLEGNFVIGENCIIGPNCSLKYFASIGDGCMIGNAVEVARSVIGDEVDMKHLAYVGDSILGNRVNIGAGTVVANLRHDNASIKMNINDNLVDSGRRKLGAVFGDKVKTGINTSIYPGVKLNVGVTTLPGEIVIKDRN